MCRRLDTRRVWMTNQVQWIKFDPLWPGLASLVSPRGLGPALVCSMDRRGQAVTGIDAAEAAGTFVGATSPVQVLTGSFKAGSTADTFAATFDPDPNANGVGFRVDDTVLGHTTVDVFDNTAADNNGDPQINDLNSSGFAPMTVSVPEPALILLLGIATLGLVKRRKRRRSNRYWI